MPLIKAREANTNVAQPEVLRLQDIEAEAVRILAAARAQADAMLAEARTQAEKMKADARKSGMDGGRSEGLKTGNELGRKQALEQAKADFAGKHASMVKAFTAALQEFDARRRGLLTEMERDVVALAGAIANRVVKAAVQVDPSCVAGNIREALQLIVEKNGLEIRLHPLDLEQAERFARDLLPGQEFQGIRFVPDENVGRGGAVLRTSSSQIDASVETQCIRILDEILAGWREHWLLSPTMMAPSQVIQLEQEPEFVEILQEDESQPQEPIARPIDPGQADETPAP